jgi:ribosomal-protein-alanine N-acetyltransferase
MFTPDDVPALASIRSDPEVMKHIAKRRTESIEEVRNVLNGILAHWQQHGFGRWALVDKGSALLAGWCGLMNASYLENTGEVEIGYGLAKQYWGKGLASEAAAATLKYGFEQVRLQRIIAVAWPENVASLRVLEKLGMRYEKRVQLFNSELLLYVISRDQYQAAKSDLETNGNCGIVADASS